MKVGIYPLALLSIIAWGMLALEPSRAGDLDSVAEISRSFADSNGVPQSTAITDLISKASRSAISSDLVVAPAEGQPTPTLLGALAEPSRVTAQAKGYLLRSIELDPRFESNAVKSIEGIKLGDLTPVSPSQGLRVPRSVVQQVDAEICLGTPSAPECGATSSSSQAEVPPVASSQLDESNGRIFGGVPTRPENDAFLDSVALVGNNKICSGAVVNEDTVITAAHCVCDGVDDEVDIGASIISPRQRVKIDKGRLITFKPCDQLKKDLSIGDVALVKLIDKVSQPAKRIMGMEEVRQAASVRAVGFGRTESSIGFKYQVNIVIASWQCDGSDYRGIPDRQVYLCQPSYELVAAGLNRDTCAGDSGSPIYVFGQDSKPYIAGITSRAVTPDNKCGSGGIYVLLSASPLREWLQSQGVTISSNVNEVR